MTTETLSAAQLEQIALHLEDKRRAGALPASPPEPSPESFSGKVLAAQRRKAQEAKRQAEEKNARLIAEREADRQEARRQLKVKSRDIEKYNTDLEQLQTDLNALRLRFGRRWPHDFGAQIEALRKRAK